MTATTSGTVSLSWKDNSNNESSFRIYQGTNGVNFSFVKATGANVTSATVTDLVPNSTYYFKMRAANSDHSPDSGIVSALTRPQAPTGLTVTGTTATTACLAWSYGGSSITNFRIYRSRDGGATFNTVGYTPDGATTTFVVENLTEETSYKFLVRACNASGAGDDSNLVDVTTSPPTPTNLAVDGENSTSTTVRLTWVDNSSTESYYRVYWLRDGDQSDQVAQVGANSQSYTVTGLIPNTGYTFYVRAVGITASPYSNRPWYLTKAQAPTGLAVAGSTHSSVSLSWSYSGTVIQNFRVYASSNGGSSYNTIGYTLDGLSTTFEAQGLQPETTYKFFVRACNASGPGDTSNVAEAKTAPPAPTDLAVDEDESTSTTVRLTWKDNSTTESYYRVYWLKDGEPGDQVAQIGANATSYTVTGLSPNTGYTFYVRAVGTDTASPYSNRPHYVTKAQAPTRLAVSAWTDTTVSLAWTYSGTSVTNFRVIASHNGGVSFNTIGYTPDALSTTFVATGLQPSTPYLFKVAACNVDGPGDQSSDVGVTTYPVAPGELAVTATTSSTVSLGWLDTRENETSYRIYQATDGYDFHFIGTTGADAESYLVRGLTPNTNYWYKIRSDGSGGGSAYSNIVQATTYSISGQVRDSSGVPVPGVELTAENGPSVSTGADGRYYFYLPQDWSGHVMPSRTGYGFVGGSRFYQYIRDGLDHEDYLADSASQNDECSTASLIAGLPYAVVEDVRCAFSSDDSPICNPSSPVELIPDVWFVYTATASSVVAADTDTSAGDTWIAAYTGTCSSKTLVACDDTGGPGDGARLALSVQAGAIYYFRVSSDAESVAFHLREVPVPSNDGCANPVVLPGVPATFTQDTSGATIAEEAPGCFNDFEGGVWFSVLPSADQTVIVDTSRSDYEAGVQAFTGDCSQLQYLCCGSPALAMRLAAGTPYRFLVGGSESGFGNLVLDVRAARAPSISDVLPLAGPPGTILDISGSGFSLASNVTVGDVSAAFLVKSDELVRAVVPPGANTGVVAVTAPGGVGTSTQVFSVEQPGVLANDLMAGATPLQIDFAGGAKNVQVAVDTTYATSLSDPVPVCMPSFGKGLWYCYAAHENCVVRAQYYDSNFFPGLAAYREPVCDPAVVACQADMARCDVPATKGDRIYFLVGSSTGQATSGTLIIEELHVSYSASGYEYPIANFSCTGPLYQTGSGVVRIMVKGDAPKTEYGQFSIGAPVRLSGAMVVDFSQYSSYPPPAGQVFDLLLSSMICGDFVSFSTIPQQIPGVQLHWQVVQVGQSQKYSIWTVADSGSWPLQQLRDAPENTRVYLHNVVVSAPPSGGVMYVQDPQVPVGVRVATSETALMCGDLVDIVGSVESRTSGAMDRQVRASGVLRLPGVCQIEPLITTCGNLGGAGLPGFGQPGIPGSQGAYNIGVLMKTIGRVIYRSESGALVCIDDAWCTPDPTGTEGVLVRMPAGPQVRVGSLIAVTGVVEGQVPVDGTCNRPVLNPRTGADIEVLDY